jgi:hypothetical protein
MKKKSFFIIPILIKDLSCLFTKALNTFKINYVFLMNQMFTTNDYLQQTYWCFGFLNGRNGILNFHLQRCIIFFALKKNVIN